MKTRQPTEREMQVMIDHVARANPRIIRGPIVPVRNPDPLAERESLGYDCEPVIDWQERCYGASRAAALGVGIGLVALAGLALGFRWLM